MTGRRNIISTFHNNKTLVKNFSYLSILQILNILLPLVTYPYLIRILGKDVLGLVVFAQAVAAYLVILVSFGFNVSATRMVSINRDNKEKLNEIFSSVTIIKVSLFILSVIILILMFFLVEQVRNQKLLFILSLWTCINELLFPVWYFQGIEKMRYITYVSIISRMISLVLIFLFIRHTGDYLLVPLFFLIGTVLSGLVSLKIILVNDHIRFSWQKISTLKLYFNDSLSIFISILAMSVFVNSNKVLIGFFMSMKDVAYYDLAEKILAFFKIPLSILSQTIFPRISKDKNIGFIRKVLAGSFILNLFLVIVLIFTAKYFVFILGGQNMFPAIQIIYVLSITVLLGAISNILGLQILVPFGYKKLFTYTFVNSGILYILMILILILCFNITLINISATVVITELAIVIMTFYYCKKNNLLLKKN